MLQTNDCPRCGRNDTAKLPFCRDCLRKMVNVNHYFSEKDPKIHNISVWIIILVSFVVAYYAIQVINPSGFFLVLVGGVSFLFTASGLSEIVRRILIHFRSKEEKMEASAEFQETLMIWESAPILQEFLNTEKSKLESDIKKLNNGTMASKMRLVERQAQELKDKELKLSLREVSLDELKNKMFLEKENELIEREEQVNKHRNAFEKLFQEKTQGFPWLSNAYGDFCALKDEILAVELESKSHPATVAAEVVRQIKLEKRDLTTENKKLSYIIEYYESLFPWLNELRDVDNDDIASITDTNYENSNEDAARRFLSTGEYDSLSTVEKYQKALDKYCAGRKTKWQIGRDFERYIGYNYEQKGYAVDYRGIIDGYEDLGRDLICRSKEKTFVVQCKCWSHKKTIHEKHVNQLLGTTIMYYIQTNSSSKVQIELFPGLIADRTIVPVLITSTCLSETAKKFAATLGVEIHEEVQLGKYPLVKCNINPETREKIYHLPFDQQYDRTQVGEVGECYAWTVKEAEEKGFRRAMRWHGPQ